MRVKSSNGTYRHAKNTASAALFDWEVLRQTRLLSGHHPDTGEKMQWNTAIRAGQ